VNATLYDSTYSPGSPDNRNNHYSNASCQLVSASENYANYTCSFSVYYYANPSEWKCEVTAADINGLEGSRSKNLSINSLYGLSIYPGYINFSSMHAGQNSTSDVNITITNYGNIEVDITLYGYGSAIGDSLSMNCTAGNISIDNERYSLTPGLTYAGMNPLSGTAMQIDAFNLEKQTLESTNSSRKVHWKIGVPLGIGGSCNGNVVIGAVPS
jgi:hypothetical protein